MKSFIQYISEVVTTKKDVSAIRKTREVQKISDGSLTSHRTRYDFKHPDGKRHVTVDYVGTTTGHHPKEDDATRKKKHPISVEMSYTVHDSKRALKNKTKIAASTERKSKKYSKIPPKPEDVKHTIDVGNTVHAVHQRELSSTKSDHVFANSSGKRKRIFKKKSERGELEHKDWHHSAEHPPKDSGWDDTSTFKWDKK
mgnify:CR=1 FL=1